MRQNWELPGQRLRSGVCPLSQVLSEAQCGHPCASLAPLCSCPAAPAAGLSLGRVTSAGSQQGLRVWAAPGSCSSSAAGREGMPPLVLLPHPAAHPSLQCLTVPCAGCPAHTELRRRFYQAISVLQLVRWNP